MEYFSRYFTWYDTEHDHSGIDYSTPNEPTRACGSKSSSNDPSGSSRSDAGAEKKT